MKENKNKSYVLYIKGVEAFEKYKIPNVELMKIKKFTDNQLVNIAKGDMFPIAKHYNKKLYKMLIKEFGNKTNVCDIWINSSIANLSFELFDKKQNLHTFKVHTEDSALDFKAFKTKKEIGRGNTAPFIFIDSFTGPGLYSGRRTMCTSQYENIFNAAREFGNRYAEVNGDCSELLNPKVGKEDSSTASKKDARPIHTPIKIDKDKCTIKFNVGGFTEKDCSLSELADKLGNDKVKEGDNISATIKLAHYELEMSLINKIAEILNSDCSVSSSLIANDKVAMILHEVEHYKFQKDFKGDEINVTSIINPINSEMPKDDTASEVSEYLDNTGYDKIINNIKISISEKYMTEKIAGKHNIILPSDFRERLCDLSYLSDLENRFKQFDNIGILQQELLLKSKDEDMLESIEELTFAQVLELFTVLADMKGMIKIKDEESGEYCLKHLEKKAELIANDIKVADITDIKISKMGVLLLTASDTIGEFGEDSKKCNWSLFKNLEEAINVLRTIHNEQKIYTLLKYQSGANTIFSNIVPRISKASFGQEFEVLLDADALFYYRNKIKFNVEETELSCKPIKIKKEHNVNMGNNWAHFAIEILEEDIKTKISIQPYIFSQAAEHQKVEQIL